MSFLETIARKRHGEALTPTSLASFVHAFSQGHVPDYQMSAFLMAVCHRGLNEGELFAFTQAMIDSGKRFDLSDIAGPKIDKHSTGGVGDKTSLILAPLAACLGLKVPMMAGRSLGFTGGTIDKLESIPGFRTDPTLGEAKAILKKVGCVVMAQSDEIAPADKKLYALRDVTATVESIPLIASSILSKKGASGIEGIVFDVKFGDGAFLSKRKDALRLAQTLVKLAKRLGLNCQALLSSMEEPLGFAVGNSLEVLEALEVLKGRGPEDLRHLTLTLAGAMLKLGKKAASLEEGMKKAALALKSGEALKKFREWIEAQGGEGEIVEKPHLLPQAAKHVTFISPASGYLKRIRTRLLGELLRKIGAGRLNLGDRVDPAVGFVLYKKVGGEISKGESLGTLHLNASLPSDVREEDFQNLFEISRRPVRPLPLLGNRVGASP